MICVCGVDCEGCPHFKGECAGCHAIQGKVYWAQYIGAEECPIYKCVKDKNLANCGMCTEMPCQIWLSLKDPAWSEEEHQKSIQDRVTALENFLGKV